MLTKIARRRTEDTAIDVVSVIVGVCLALSPFAFGYVAAGAGAWNAWIMGTAIALVALGTLVAFAEWEEWVNLVLGVWTIVAPWALGFSAVAAAMYTHLIAGVVVAGLAALELWMIHTRPMTAS